MRTNKKESNGYKNAVFYSPQHKMGVKALDEEQLINIFPSYISLQERIEEHRSYVNISRIKRDTMSEYFKLDEQYNMMFDNVFSIMGKRGSGKTSVVYTLKKKFEDARENDVVLPIIISELIPDSCEIIGWILSLLEDIVSKISKKLDIKRKNSDVFKTCRVKRSLEEEYDKVKELCYSKAYNVEGEESFSQAVFNSERRTQNSFDFSRYLSQFWTSMVEAIREVHSLESEEEPLIYVIFDDVDLVPEKVWELLSTIVKYLSHPNVVVIVTAEEEMLYSVVKNTLYAKMSNKAKVEKEIAPSPQWFLEMAKLYVDKILPPSTRYYIESFESCTRKATFVEQLKFSKSGDVSAKIRLETFLENAIDDYLKAIDSNSIGDDFLHYNGTFIKAYLLFWGDTSRQLGNECIIIEELTKNLKRVHNKYAGTRNKTSYLQELYQVIYYFVFTTLNINNKIRISSMELRTLVDNLVSYQPEYWGIYLNYHYLTERFENKLNNNDFVSMEKENIEKEKSLNDILSCVKENIVLYMLMFFVENILWEERKTMKRFWKGNDTRVHGQYSLVEMLDKITNNDVSLVRRDVDSVRLQEFLYKYGGVLENPEVLMKFDNSSASDVRRYFDTFYKDTDEKKHIHYYCLNNPKWFRSMVKLLYLSKTGIYNISSSQIYGLYSNRRNIYDIGLERLDKEEKNLICNFLAKRDGKLFEYENTTNTQDEAKKGWEECETTEEMYSYVVQRLSFKNSLEDKAEKCYDILRNHFPQKYKQSFEYIFGKVATSGTGFIMSYILDAMRRLTLYKVVDPKLFEEKASEVKEYMHMSIDTALNINTGEAYIEIDHFNALMNELLIESVKIDEDIYGFGWDRRYRLKEIYSGLRKSVGIALDWEYEKKTVLELVVLKKLHMYMKLIELSNSILSQTNARLNPPDIPYAQFFDNILNVRDGKPEKVDKSSGNDGEDISDENNAYTSTLIDEYIREGVKEYVESLVGANS